MEQKGLEKGLPKWGNNSMATLWVTIAFVFTGDQCDYNLKV